MDNWQYFTSDSAWNCGNFVHNISHQCNNSLFCPWPYYSQKSTAKICQHPWLMLFQKTELLWHSSSSYNHTCIDLSGSCLPQTENKRICQIFGLKKWKKKPKPGFHLKYFYESNGLNFPWFAHITNVLWYFGKRFKNVTNYELNIPSAYCLYCPYKMLLW